MKNLVLGILTILITLTLAAYADSDSGPIVAGGKKQLALAPMTENNEKSPFFTVTINKYEGEWTPLVWQCEVDFRTYFCALGKARLNPDIQIHNENITAEDVQKAGVFDKAQNDALSKLKKYLGKDFFMEFTVYQNSIYYSPDKKVWYVIGLVPIKNPVPLTGLPDFLKRSDGHALALIMEGKSYGHKYIYGLGLAQANPKRDNWSKVLDLAFKDSEQKLARFLGVKNPMAMRKKWSNPAEMQDIAWAICQVRVE
ncbi:MAG: hypothetical protein NTX00_00375 [Candidatus Parcubacteria bacterium]|nr:hypothetical protein [Candidatus Parcubacteria bacterium]